MDEPIATPLAADQAMHTTGKESVPHTSSPIANLRTRFRDKLPRGRLFAGVFSVHGGNRANYRRV